jgi:hypothetical protein
MRPPRVDTITGVCRPLFTKQARQGLFQLRVHRNAPTGLMLGDGSPDLNEITDAPVGIENHRPFECCDFAGAQTCFD